MASVALLAPLAAAYIAWGTVQTAAMKWAYTLAAPAAPARYGPYTYTFAHPFVQALAMFIAELLCLVVFVAILFLRYAMHHRQPRAGVDMALPCNPTVWMLPAAADFGASVLQNVGLTLTYASVYQMLRGAVVVFIAALSYVWLHRRFSRRECIGIGVVVIGLTLVGISAIMRPSPTTKTDSNVKVGGANRNPLLGAVLIIAAQLLHAYQGVCEERLGKLYHVPPLQMVGTEGAYGVGMTLMLLSFLQLFPSAPFAHNIVGTIPDDVANATVNLLVPYDDIVLAFDQMQQNTVCLISMIIYILAGLFYNACQITIIKKFSAATCVMLGSLRNVTVWIVALALPSVFEEHFDLLQLIGFCCLVAGNVVYQQRG
ncbi:putative solute carrier family 35 member F6-like isoform X1 [Trypanosoma theileri]|uniref:Putative solute carrier family 35 member F6-like isoform X1 n=1 Tax=Trypanosoma theileri TaxID=67003 RepID=A0A1X0P938_9TRYP|nr:putative solute carrier family 35 member F6-like isoform X1 [Trypanosoma theileri]ORC93143.1 putative solute carrier family 35 member F6-like isoform X1 [Trypanosoma theileri]